MKESYPIKPCLDCGHTRPEVTTYSNTSFKLPMTYFTITCPECDKSTDCHYKLRQAVEQWDNDRERLLPKEVRDSIKKINERHTWRFKKKSYLP